MPAKARCVQPQPLEAKLLEILREHAQARDVDLLVSVSEQGKDTQRTRVSLRGVTGDGDIVLERQFELSASDCASSTELLATVLERFVEKLPLERWTLGPAPPPPVAPAPDEPDLFGLETNARLDAGGAFPPLGASFEGGALVDLHWGAHGLSLQAGLRCSLPRELGQGSFLTLLPFAGAGWGYRFDRWFSRIGARTGALMVAGSGFSSNEAQWLPWFEFQADFGRRFGFGSVLLTFAASPFRHSAATASEAAVSQIPNVRIGLAVEYTFGGQDSQKSGGSSGD